MPKAERDPGKIRRIAALSAGAASVLALPIASEVRVTRAMRPLTDGWQHVSHVDSQNPEYR